MLLERKVNPRGAGHSSRTLLPMAALNGREGVVKMLLKQVEVNVHKTDMWKGGLPVFPTVQSVRLRVKTGRTTAHSPSFLGCQDGLRPGR